MSIDSIYEPIQQELLLVEENLVQVARAAPQEIVELLEHVLKDGGKRMRPALTLLAGKFYRYDLELLLPTATAVELLHTATLVHDDAIDNSLWRRAKPTVNSLWGDSAALLVGDYLFGTSASMAAKTGNVRVMKLFAQTLVTTSSGEIGQTFNCFSLSQSKQDYFQRIGSKTACLFSTAAESGAVLSGAPEEAVQALKSYAYNLGIGFQIVDDVLDLIGREETMGKPVGSDLLHGVLTLPTILLVEHYPKDNPIERVFRTGSQEDINVAVNMIRESSIIDECYRVVQDFRSQACLALEPLPHDRAYHSLIDLANYIVERSK